MQPVTVATVAVAFTFNNYVKLVNWLIFLKLIRNKFKIKTVNHGLPRRMLKFQRLLTVYRGLPKINSQKRWNNLIFISKLRFTEMELNKWKIIILIILMLI